MAVAVPTLALFALTQKVQLRLVQVLLYMLHHFPRATHPVTQKRKLPQPRVEGIVALLSSHILHPGKKVRCMACGLAPASGDEFVQFVRSPCVEADNLDQALQLRRHSFAQPRRVPVGIAVCINGARLHPSHRLVVYQGFYACTLCGRAAAQRVRLLAEPCVGSLLPSGTALLRRLNRGQLPWGVKQWPSPLSGGAPCLEL